MDILLNTLGKCLKSCINVLHTYTEGTVSQIFYVGPNYDFMKSRKKGVGKLTKSYPFLVMK